MGDVENERAAEALIARGSSAPVAPSTTDLAPDVQAVTAPGWVPAPAARGTNGASVATADTPGAPGATERVSFVLERPAEVAVSAPAVALAPGEPAARR